MRSANTYVMLPWLAVLGLVLAVNCQIPGLEQAANGVAGGEDGTPSIAMVSLKDIAFHPPTLTIQVGQTVRWTNEETSFVLHAVTSGDPGDTDAGSLFQSDFLQPGQSFEHVFDQAGTFKYHCEPFSNQMRNAEVIVP